MVTEERIGELWDEAVGEGWSLNHEHIIRFVRLVERAKVGPRWIPVSERLPRYDLPVMLWGDDLVVGLDHPLTGRLCACHEEWVLDLADSAEAEGRDVDHAKYLLRMLGTVTHWLEWSPGPED